MVDVSPCTIATSFYVVFASAGGFLAPVVNAGYASVSYFILLSGFVMAYNYSARARAGQFDTIRYYKARFTRLYPIYLLSFILAWRMIPQEWASHTHGMFWAGAVLAPLMLQGWIPEIATFLNTPAWTMSAEASYYVVFPWMARWKKPCRIATQLWKLGGVWMLDKVTSGRAFGQLCVPPEMATLSSAPRISRFR